MIFYFSATGNSKYVAEQIASATDDRLISTIPKARVLHMYFSAF